MMDKSCCSQISDDQEKNLVLLQQQIQDCIENFYLYGLFVPYDPTTATIRIEGKIQYITFLIPLEESTSEGNT